LLQSEALSMLYICTKRKYEMIHLRNRVTYGVARCTHEEIEPLQDQLDSRGFRCSVSRKMRDIDTLVEFDFSRNSGNRLENDDLESLKSKLRDDGFKVEGPPDSSMGKTPS